MKKLKKILLALVLFSGFLFVLPTSVRASAEEPEIAEALETAEEAQEAGIPGDLLDLGDGLTVYITRAGDEVIFSGDNISRATLPKDFMKGHDKEKVRSITVNNNIRRIYLPEDSSYLFADFPNLETLELSKFDTSRVKDMSYMFSLCKKLKQLDLSGFNTSNVENMMYMFMHCESLTELDLRSFNTARVRIMNSMFLWCRNLKKLDVSSFNTSNVTSIDFMFCNLASITELDLSSFDLSKVREIYEYDAKRSTFNMGDLLVLKTPRNFKPYSEFIYWGMYDKNGKKYTTMPNTASSMVLYNSKILAGGGFKDVKDKNAWYYLPVYWAVARGYTSGMGEGTFQPMAKLTRAQAVAFLYKLRGSPDPSWWPEINFSDVPKDAWYYNAVRWAVGAGITSGYGTGTFRPNVDCNRAMIVTFLMNYAKDSVQYKTPTTSSSFKDVPADAWYKPAVDWAVENGITSGYGEGTFRPNAICNRAMMVTFIKSLSKIPLYN